jgi:hypothetical protein
MVDLDRLDEKIHEFFKKAIERKFLSAVIIILLIVIWVVVIPAIGSYIIALQNIQSQANATVVIDNQTKNIVTDGSILNITDVYMNYGAIYAKGLFIPGKDYSSYSISVEIKFNDDTIKSQSYFETFNSITAGQKYNVDGQLYYSTGNGDSKTLNDVKSIDFKSGSKLLLHWENN